ncbi:hypothetical protein [Gimesia sp.]|uniref:hypothetical protein n=1 Tax=Gimesia sp. TaxID=2024833 RepID=UPI003A943FE8
MSTKLRWSLFVIVLLPLIVYGLNSDMTQHCFPDHSQQDHESQPDIDSISEIRSSIQVDSESTPGIVLREIKLILVQFNQALEAHIGWLRPQSVKERALFWLVLCVAVPWLFAGFLDPFAITRSRLLSWLIVLVWTGLSIWSAWHFWGVDAGSKLFGSTMIVLVPLLSSYFHYVRSCFYEEDSSQQDRTVSGA